MQAGINAESRTALLDGRRRNWFWDHNEVFGSNLSSNAILVRLYIARCANEDRQAWPSLSTIAKNCKISRKTVQRALNELEETGWLARTIRRQASGEHQTTLYVLQDPPAGSGKEILPAGDGPGESQPGSGGVGSQRPYPVTDDQGVGSQGPYLGSQRPYVGSQGPPNNTNITIPMNNTSSGGRLSVSSLRSDTDNGDSALRASSPAGGQARAENNHNGHSEKTTTINRNGCPKAAGTADAARSRDQGKSAEIALPAQAGGSSRQITNKALIDELVDEYRAVEGVAGTKGDHSFIGMLYNRYGYGPVLEGIYELSLSAGAQEIKKPLLYLKTVVKRNGGNERGRGGRLGFGSGRSVDQDDESKRGKELIKRLYMN